MRLASAFDLLARFVLPALLLVGWSSPAAASSPVATYVVPSQVQFFPDEASATRVIIHGAFFFWQSGGTYNQPACGYMYFSCPVGQEAMCRMQWGEIKSAIGLPQCEGFGQQNMVSKATLRTEDTAPQNPDSWDLGIGVVPGSFVGGQCAPAQALKCPVPVAPADMAGPSTPTPDLATPGATVGTPMVGGCSLGGAQGAVGGTLLLLTTAVATLMRRRRRA
jgi:hypothetical protein